MYIRILAAIAGLAAIGSAESRGYLTTPGELKEIRSRASKGVEPYRSAVLRLMESVAMSEMPKAASGRVNCSASRQPEYVTSGASVAYGFALAYHIAGDSKYAARARTAILGLTHITELAAGDCPLTMGRHIPNWIRAADLIDDYWSRDEKRAFQDWLAQVVYPSLATKYRRGNNWGAMITNGGQYIADYCHDRPELKLDGHSPSEAYRLMRQTALDRINGAIWDACGEGVSMIRPDGGIPEELRRSTRCDDTQVTEGSAAHHYLEGYISGLIAQAELCLRRGDRELYENACSTVGRTNSGKLLPPGRGSVRKGIDFVLARASWDKKSSLLIAARYFRDKRMLTVARGLDDRDRINQFAYLTHDYAVGEMPKTPPTTAPPK